LSHALKGMHDSTIPAASSTVGLNRLAITSRETTAGIPFYSAATWPACQEDNRGYHPSDTSLSPRRPRCVKPQTVAASYSPAVRIGARVARARNLSWTTRRYQGRRRGLTSIGSFGELGGDAHGRQPHRESLRNMAGMGFPALSTVRRGRYATPVHFLTIPAQVMAGPGSYQTILPFGSLFNHPLPGPALPSPITPKNVDAFRGFDTGPGSYLSPPDTITRSLVAFSVFQAGAVLRCQSVSGICRMKGGGLDDCSRVSPALESSRRLALQTCSNRHGASGMARRPWTGIRRLDAPNLFEEVGGDETRRRNLPSMRG